MPSRLHVARLVIAFLITNAKTTTLDLLATVGVLEGMAGVKPGSWMKDAVPTEEREARTASRRAVNRSTFLARLDWRKMRSARCR